MVRDKLTFYPKSRNRDFMKVYPEVRYDYLFTELSEKELLDKYQLGNKANLNELILVIKEELELPKSRNRVDIQRMIHKGELKVEEWL